MFRYLAFGLTVESDLELPFRACTAVGTPDVLVRGAAEPYHGPRRPLALRRKGQADAVTDAAIERCGEGILVRYDEDIELRIAAGSIVCHPCRDGGFPERWAVSLYVPGAGFSLVLEMQGIPVLHASAIAVDEHAVVFLASSGSGKSTLAAAFVGAGFPLIADDVVAVDPGKSAFFARSAYPRMRLWPEEARELLGIAADRLATVHPGADKRSVLIGTDGFGAFQESSLPISAVYALDRRASGEPCCVEAVTPGRAIIDLVRHSFAAHVVEEIGLQPSRLAAFGALASATPVRRISYPTGRENLDRIRDAILMDLGC